MSKVSMCEVSTPEMLWHGSLFFLLFNILYSLSAMSSLCFLLGGVNDNGKTDPVYSIDCLGCNLVATSGIDDSEPSRGCVRVNSLAFLS